MIATSRSALRASRRRAYLHALGIALYHPRQQLPGARPSTLLASLPPARTTAAQPAAVPPDPMPAVRPAAQAARAQLQAAAPAVSRATPAVPDAPPLTTPPPATSGRTAEAPKSAPATEEAAGVAEPVAFAFAFVPVNGQIAVINELPIAGAPLLTPDSRRLLAGMLKALTLPVEERNLSSQSFVWPAPDLPATEQGAAPARELLKGFLARRFSIVPVKYLLVLAEQGAPYLFPAGFSIKEGELFQHPDFDVKVLTTRSLGAMEAVPALKREVWSALQPLLRALQGAEEGVQTSRPQNSRQDP